MPIFTGIYELAEAGRYLYATSPRKPSSYQAIRRWVRSGIPVSEGPSVPAGDLFLTFEDLVSLRMIVALRIAGFSLQHIRQVHRWLQQTTSYGRPFALKDLWISETEIFAEMAEQLLSATRLGQYDMEFIEDWLRQLRWPIDGSFDLKFSKMNGREVASAWMPHPYVVFDPLIQFGAPCIEGTRIPTRSILSMSLGGDRLESIARDYDVRLIKAQSALDWEKKLAGLPS